MARDFAGEYCAAAVIARNPASSTAERRSACEVMDRIYTDTERADVDLDVLEIDERARQQFYEAVHPWRLLSDIPTEGASDV